MSKLLLVIFLALISAARADVIEIELNGVLPDWTNIEAYPGLVAPVPFSMTFRIADGPDLDPLPDRGIYRSTDLALDFVFGPYHETHPGVQVEVYSGRDDLYGFFFRNAFPVEAFGIARPAEFGIYAFFVSTGDPAVAPTDALHWVVDSAGSPALNPNRHALMNGVDDAGNPVHAEADEEISLYTAQVVPEPGVLGLLAGGLYGGLIGRGRRTPKHRNTEAPT